MLSLAGGMHGADSAASAGFEYAKRVEGYIVGYRRVFYQGSTDHRGVPGAPGRVVTLEHAPGARCWGAAYLLAGDYEQQQKTLAVSCCLSLLPSSRALDQQPWARMAAACAERLAMHASPSCLLQGPGHRAGQIKVVTDMQGLNSFSGPPTTVPGVAGEAV